MKFRKFGKTVLTAALSSAIVFSLSSCVRSFTVGYFYATGTVTATPSGNGIITGFKIDNNTGKLTPLHAGIVGSGGANPVRAVLLTGGRFVYVLNAGTNAEGGTACTVNDPCTNANISQFVVGGNGVLTPQETFFTQGVNPFRLVADTSGKYLFALDHDAPSNAYCAAAIPGSTSCGDVTVFSIDATTGRLSLVTNAQLTSSQGTNVTYFPVPANPIDFVLAGGYIMTLSGTAGDTTNGQTVYPYSYNSSNGQLTTSGSTPQILNNGGGGKVSEARAIVYAGSKVYVLDNESLLNNTTGITSPAQILPYTIGNNGLLSSLTGGAVQDDPTQTDPIYLIVESKAKFLYVANQNGADTTSGAGIAGFTIDPASSQLSFLAGEPFKTGSTPQCLVEDPSNQFVYTANSSDNTVTGRTLNPNDGTLNAMRGSTGTFALTGPASWCFVTGRTN